MEILNKDNQAKSQPHEIEPKSGSFQIQKTIQIEDQAIRQENEFEINLIPNESGKLFSEKKYANPYRAYFPKFYVKELKNALISMVLALVMFSIILSVSAYGIFWFTTNTIGASPWLSLLALPVVGFPLLWTVIQITRYTSFFQESKTINFKSEKVVSLNVQKLYKRLKVAYIDICWSSASIYIVMLLTMLITCITSFVIYGGAFGDMWLPINTDSNYVYISLFWGSVAIICTTVLYQIVGILSSYLRYTRIDNFYNFVLVSEEELKATKKQKTRRNLVIFLATTAVVSLIFFVVYKLIKRTRTTNVIVK